MRARFIGRKIERQIDKSWIKERQLYHSQEMTQNKR